MTRSSLVAIALGAVVACKSSSSAEHRAAIVSAPHDAAVAARDGSAKAAVQLDAPAAAGAPATAESVHAELVPVIDRWIHDPGARAGMYRDGFEHNGFAPADAHLDLATWLATVVAPLEIDGMHDLGCWMEFAPGRTDVGHTCVVDYWYHRSLAGDAGFDSGGWFQMLERAPDGHWQIVKEGISSQFTSASLPWRPSPRPEPFIFADLLRPRLTLRWTEIDRASGGAIVELVFTDDHGATRVVDLESPGAHCGEATAARKLLALHCDAGVVTDFVIGAQKPDGELPITRTPPPAIVVLLRPHAHITLVR